MYQPSDRPPSQNKRLKFLDQVSPDYMESLEEQYAQNPQSVSDEWAFFFEAFRLGQGEPLIQAAPEDSAIINELRVLEMISIYRKLGHIIANIDPLQSEPRKEPPDFSLARFKLDKVDPHHLFQAASDIGLPPSTISAIEKHLKNTYCRQVGVEFRYIRNEKVYDWLKKRIDSNENTTPFSIEKKKEILKHLAQANHFENFLQNNYMGQKRFSLEGGEAIIPALKHAIDVSSGMGAEEMIIGMAHRGRLNVLINILQKPVEEIFKEFEGAELPGFAEATGDVKYHQGFSTDVATATGKKIHLSLAPNPSHLEFVDPVVEGMTRAKMEERYGGDKNRIVPLLIHGDAAVIGQGIVPETLNLSQLKGYSTGGTIHVVINNQIGFTTSPTDSRSTFYCTDLGQAFQCPIFHVNGNDPEAVVHAIEMATEFRMTFHRDVFVDIVCYRKYGHNEGDEPRFTQPVMYDLIGKQKNPFQIYREHCETTGVCDPATADGYLNDVEALLTERRSRIKNASRVLELDSLKGHWQGFSQADATHLIDRFPSSIEPAVFENVLEVIHKFPEGFHSLPKFQKMIESRKQKIDGDDEIDWASGEALAFGSLLSEGYAVRLSGQDAVRGTFSHRHAGFTDAQSAARYFPLQHLKEGQAKFDVYDSPLSEAAVLGFDYGYSLASPKTLVLWEAQFGDFANGAQVIIDQFISSGETKWYRMSGITLLLPHGYEGQGPEHSSARLERFLQLCGQNNIQVCYPTTPANYCHLLRRQMLRKFRKPLVVMTPKSLLRHPLAISRKSDFLKGAFYNIFEDVCRAPERVILCSGKVYYDLKKRALETEMDQKVLFVRIEQLYPLDGNHLKTLHEKWKDIPWVWCQEEPKNMGAWSYMRLKTIDLGIELKYAGRSVSASPATGSPIQHQRELDAFLKEALGL